jgi:hypothetical protein
MKSSQFLGRETNKFKRLVGNIGKFMHLIVEGNYIYIRCIIIKCIVLVRLKYKIIIPVPPTIIRKAKTYGTIS